MSPLPEGMNVAHWRAYCWDVHRGTADDELPEFGAGSAYADINININILKITKFIENYYDL